MNLWQIAGQPEMKGEQPGWCRICGNEGIGLSFVAWVRDTFTDHDKLRDGDIICHACQFLFDEASEILRQRVGKDKLQRMRNYSHFVVNDVWYPLSKGDKDRMKHYLFGEELPQLAVIAESGQKHILFRAMWNQPGRNDYGYIQFEEHGAFINRRTLRDLLSPVEELYQCFNKEAIETGRYNSNYIMKCGIDWWQSLEKQIQKHRNTLLLQIALFLAKKGEMNDGVATKSSGLVDDNLAGNSARLQTQVFEHLGAI